MFRVCLTTALALCLGGCVTVPQPDATEPVEVQILAINDFHGALLPSDYDVEWMQGGQMQSAPLGGAARLGSLLRQLREGRSQSITVAAGDLISASPIMSSRFLDEPAVAVLGLAGLEIASVGNHEFDRGTAELKRMQEGGCEQHTSRQPCALEPFEGAQFSYLAGNTLDENDQPLFSGTVLRDFGLAKIGFIGLTLRDTALLVPPSGITGYRFTDEAETANRLAADMVGQGADVIVLLIHEGGNVEPRNNETGCPSLSGAIVPILDQLDPAIRLIVSGHTHQAYACQVGGDGKPQRTLTSAGSNGSFVTDVRLTIDPLREIVLAVDAQNIPVAPDLPEVPEIAAIVKRYADAASAITDRVVGSFIQEQGGPSDCWDTAAQRLVADAQLNAAGGGAEIAFVNSQGVRTPLSSNATGSITFGQIYAMQPFGNSLTIVNMTGEQIGRLLEGQFCDGNPAKPCFSYLIPSEGFAYSVQRHQPPGKRVTAMTLGGQPIDANRTYSIVVGNFLQGGGDGFATFKETEVVGNAGNDLDALEGWLSDGATIGRCGRVRDLTASGG